MEYRNTRQKSIILSTIHKYGHLTSEELLELLKDEKISIATIYRNLNILAEEGKIKKINSDNKTMYETIKDEHYHFECTCCHNVTDIDPSLIKISLNHSLTGIAKKTIFLYGICNSCQNNK